MSSNRFRNGFIAVKRPKKLRKSLYRKSRDTFKKPLMCLHLSFMGKAVRQPQTKGDLQFLKLHEVVKVQTLSLAQL